MSNQNLSEALALVEHSFEVRTTSFRKETEQEKELLKFLYSSECPLAQNLLGTALSEIEKRNLSMHPVAAVEPIRQAPQGYKVVPEKHALTIPPHAAIPGNIIRMARGKKGYSQKELNKLIGGSASLVCQIETSKITTTSSYYYKIREALGI